MTYSKDLVNIVLYYSNNTNLSIRKIANLLLISKSTVHRWINQNYPNKIQNIKKDKYTSKNKKILSFLKNSLNQNPYQTLNNLKTKIKKKFDKSICCKTVSNYLKIINYKKKRAVKKLYKNNLKEYFQELYIKYGWIKRNKKLIKYIKRNTIPKKMSLIMAINQKGIIKYELYKEKSINTKIFKKFITELLKNIKNKYILMDNINFHKSKEVLEIITKNNNQPLFIPAYSPEFNPIEEVFSELKSFIRKNINFKNFNKKINILIKRFTKNIKNLKNYYRHAFN